jgi:hypothetical protein
MKRLFSIAAALSISLFIYVFYRSEKTVVNELLILILSYDTYTAIKSSVIHAMPLNKTLIFSLPGGLWIFCATNLSQDFYVKIRNHTIQVFLVPILFVIGLEFCQLIHFVHGTFDRWDIAFYLAFWLLAYYSFHPRCAQQNLWAPFTLRGFLCLACIFSVYLAHVSQ